MQIVMFDRQSIFIHGMKISLQQRIPGVSIQGASQADELWQKLESYPEALVMLDGDQDGEFCYWLLQKTVVQFPEVKVLITATDCNKRWLQEVIHFNVLAIVPRDSTVETFALAVNPDGHGYSVPAQFPDADREIPTGAAVTGFSRFLAGCRCVIYR